MAPDKIYVAADSELGFKNTKTAIAFSFEQKFDTVGYIRKDALLEWAKRLKEKWEEPPMSRHSPGCVFMLEQVIKKIESL